MYFDVKNKITFNESHNPKVVTFILLALSYDTDKSS